MVFVKQIMVNKYMWETFKQQRIAYSSIVINNILLIYQMASVQQFKLIYHISYIIYHISYTIYTIYRTYLFIFSPNKNRIGLYLSNAIIPWSIVVLVNNCH